MGIHPAQIAVKRQPRNFRGGFGGRHGHGQNRIGAQLAFIFGAVEFDHGKIDVPLSAAIHADDFRSDFMQDILHGVFDALAVVAFLVAVAKLDRFVLAGGRSRGNGGPGRDSGNSGDFSLDRGITPGIQNFSGVNIDDFWHMKKRPPLLAPQRFAQSYNRDLF